MPLVWIVLIIVAGQIIKDAIAVRRTRLLLQAGYDPDRANVDNDDDDDDEGVQKALAETAEDDECTCASIGPAGGPCDYCWEKAGNEPRR